MRFGYKASAEQFAPSQLMDFAVEAEQAGFESVWVSDHFQPWKHTDGHAPFAPAWMAAVLARTEKVVLGTSVLTPTFRLHPSVVAHAFGTLGAMFPGRVILGVGTGESLNEVPPTGIVWPELKERSARMREAIKLIRQLWTEDRVSFEGEYYKTVNATIYDKPANPVPIYVAAAGPLNAKYAGRAGDGFICTSGKGAELYVDELLPNVKIGREESALKDQPFERMIEVKVSFDTDPDRALNDTRNWAALSLSAEEKHSVQDPAEMERLADALPIERVAKRWIVSSDPDEHVAAIKTYIDYGFDHLVFHAPGTDQSRFL
ncbi:MAG TPA: glucose-6-phosphate dehydrogenase (coenzyme-F420), partial [Devosia sp.]